MYRKKFWSVRLLTVAGGIAAFCALLYAAQDKMIYHNAKCPESREFLRGLAGYSEVSVPGAGDKVYNGVLYTQVNEKAPLLIYFGGNGEVSYRHMKIREQSGQWEYFSGYNYLYVDYEGYGINEGKTGYIRMYEQALAVYDYAALLPNTDPAQIAVMGFSIGTGPAVYLSAKRDVKSLILAAPYANGYDFYNNALPIFKGPMRLLVKQKYPSEIYAANVTCPVLVIASRTDPVIPFASSERLAGFFSNGAQFIALEKAGHSELFTPDVYKRIKGFLGQ